MPGERTHRDGTPHGTHAQQGLDVEAVAAQPLLTTCMPSHRAASLHCAVASALELVTGWHCLGHWLAQRLRVLSIFHSTSRRVRCTAEAGSGSRPVRCRTSSLSLLVLVMVSIISRARLMSAVASSVW